MRRPLHWICYAPTPYNAALFRALAADPDIDLTVHYVHAAAGTHPWATNLIQGYRAHFPRRRIGIDWPLLRQVLPNRHGVLIAGSWNEVTLQLLLSIRQRPLIIWTDTPNLHQQRTPLKAFLRSAWLKRVFARASFVMGTGAPALEALTEMGCPRDRLVNFPYFIDPHAYPHQTHGLKMTRPVFVSSGRLAQEKGYDLALAALARLYHENPDGFRYRLAGTGPELDALTRQAETLGIRSSIEFLGWLEPEALLDIYSSADIFLHPARLEPYGVAVLEAMASGLIVIGSDATGSVRDRIHPGINGLMHAAGDAGSLVREIRNLLQNPDSTSRMRLAARQTAEEWPISRGVGIIKQLMQRCD